MGSLALGLAQEQLVGASPRPTQEEQEGNVSRERCSPTWWDLSNLSHSLGPPERLLTHHWREDTESSEYNHPPLSMFQRPWAPQSSS